MTDLKRKKFGAARCIKKSFFVLALCGLFLFVNGVTSQPASACHVCCCFCPCTCVTSQHKTTKALIINQHIATELHITSEFQRHQRWIFITFFHNHVLPAWMKATEQLSAVGMQQVAFIGAFLDAKQQLELQRLLQKKEADAHRDYHSDVEICTIGTAAKGLAGSDRRGEFNAIFLTEYSQDRQLGNENSNAAEGITSDRINRARQFTRMFCDINDNNMGLEPMCGAMTPIRERNLNKDVDYTRFVDINRTLDVDFSDTTLTEDEQAVLALHDYLFSHDVFDRPTKSQIRVTENQDDYYDLRSVVAKRSVAENSFNTIIGLKSRGGAASAGEFMAGVFQHLGGTAGVSYADAIAMLGSEQPSYLAMMEVMAKKVYQQPDFFTNLYGKPANVRRKEVAMQAVDLMLGRDMYRSDLRSEALFSVLLEMELSKYQEDLQDQMQIQINYNYGEGK